MNIGRFAFTHSFNRYRNNRSLIIPSIAIEHEEFCEYHVLKLFFIIGRHEFSYACIFGLRPKQPKRQRWEVKE